MSDRVEKTIDRVEDVLKSGESEYDRHVVIQPPEDAQTDDLAIIRLSLGDLQDGTGFQYRVQHLEAFHTPARMRPGEWFEFAKWLQSNTTGTWEGEE